MASASRSLGPFAEVLMLAVPTMGMYLLLISSESISLVALGRASGSTTHEIAGLGLGNLVYNCAALAVGFGFTGSQDTLVTQAAGRGDHALCRLYLHRCQVWMFVIFVISGLIVSCTEQLLLFLNVTDEATAGHAGTYSRLCVAGLLGTFQYSALRKFLLAKKDAMAGLLVQSLSVPLHVMWCALLVPRHRMLGVGIAMLVKGWTDFLLLAVYVSFVRPHPSYHGWWRFWRALQGERIRGGLCDYLKLAVPGVVLTAAEWWAFEMLGLFAGYLHAPAKLAAHVTAANISSILYLSGTGAQKAASSLVGAAAGRGAEGEARSFVRAALAWNCICGTFMGLLAVLLRRPLAGMYAPNNPDVQDLLSALLPILAVQGLLDGANQSLQGALYGYGLQSKASTVSLCCYWLVLPPAALLLCFPVRLEVAGLWLGCGIASVVALFFNSRIYGRSNFDAVARAAESRMELDSHCHSLQQCEAVGDGR